MRLIKDKKGASKFFEMLMLAPFCIYIVLLSLYKIVGMIAYDNLIDYTATLSREAIVEKDLSYALNELAEIAYNSPEYQVLEIRICLSDYSYPQTLTFAKTGTTGSFVSYCKTENNEIKFDVNTFKKSISNYEEFNTMWKIGNIIQVSCYQDLKTNLFKKMTTVTLWTPDGPQPISLGLPSDVYASVALPISNEK